LGPTSVTQPLSVTVCS